LRSQGPFALRIHAPTLAAIDDQVTPELSPIVITNTATDSSTPAFGLTYLLSEAPAGAVVDAAGIITWVPTEEQGPSTNQLTTIVTDSAVPPLSATNSFLVVVTEVNSAPSLPPVQPLYAVEEFSSLMVTNTAVDPDLPANSLSYMLLNSPLGSEIDSNGVITWTPDGSQEAQLI